MTEQLRIWAGVQGFLSLAALVALMLFFALATPFAAEQRQWSWLGPVNDWLMVFGTVPWIVAMVLLVARVRGGPLLWGFTLLVCLGVAAVAVVTVLMLAGRSSLAVQTFTVIPVTLAAFVWGAVAGSAARAAAALPPWVAVLAVVLLLALLVGLVAGALGYVAPAGSALQRALYVTAGAIGGPAWVGFPLWWLAVAATAR